MIDLYKSDLLKLTNYGKNCKILLTTTLFKLDLKKKKKKARRII